MIVNEKTWYLISLASNFHPVLFENPEKAREAIKALAWEPMEVGQMVEEPEITRIEPGEIKRLDYLQTPECTFTNNAHGPKMVWPEGLEPEFKPGDLVLMEDGSKGQVNRVQNPVEGWEILVFPLEPRSPQVEQYGLFFQPWELKRVETGDWEPDSRPAFFGIEES